MPDAIELLLAATIGYLLGAIPTGVLICKALGAPDARQEGSGHTGGLNVSRQAGIWAGALTGILDTGLGALAVAVASHFTGSPWAAAAAGVMAVVGHNWSVFIGFRGGIGLSKLFGALLVFATLPALAGAAIFLIVWPILVKLLRVHRARATVLLMAIAGPVFWLLGLSFPGILLGMAGGLAVIVKTLPDWRRAYE